MSQTLKQLNNKNNAPVSPKATSHPSADQIKKDKNATQHPTEKEIDHTLEDSFPASDPPGHY